MFLNYTPDRFKQIVWNDTAKDPYSMESTARRLLVNFDYMPFMGDGYKIVERITGYTLEQQIKLTKKNEKAINSVMRCIKQAELSSKILHESGSLEQRELQDNIEHIMQEVLGLTNEQYDLLREGR